MCACLENQPPEVDETCSGEAAKPVNAWVRDGTWKRGSHARAGSNRRQRSSTRIHRCFQAGIGDPLPPRR